MLNRRAITAMPQTDEPLRQHLLAMVAEESSVREELAADGSLFEGYHPRMQRIHARNAEELRRILQQAGWPGRSLVGEDGADAAWLIAQHAIAEPELQRQALVLVQDAVERGEAPSWQAAFLDDRIRMFEGRPQLYGTQFDWDEEGEMSPYPAIEEEETVDERRWAVGLRSLEEEIVRKRAAVRESGERPPADHRERRRAMAEWARAVGWRE